MSDKPICGAGECCILPAGHEPPHEDPNGDRWYLHGEDAADFEDCCPWNRVQCCTSGGDVAAFFAKAGPTHRRRPHRKRRATRELAADGVLSKKTLRAVGAQIKRVWRGIDPIAEYNAPPEPEPEF